MALNDAAKKAVAREARATLRAIDAEHRFEKLGANQDDLISEAWQMATGAYPDFKKWSGAFSYFESVCINLLRGR